MDAWCLCEQVPTQVPACEHSRDTVTRAADQVRLRVSVCAECTPPVLASVGPFEVTIILPASFWAQHQRLSFFSAVIQSLTGLFGCGCKRGWAGGTPGFDVAEWCVARSRRLYISLCSCPGIPPLWACGTLRLGGRRV